MGSKAFILRMTPPNAPTQSIMTTVQLPAAEKPDWTSFRKAWISVTVPANQPKIREEKIPVPRQIRVFVPIPASTSTSTRGIAMYWGTPLRTCWSSVTAAGRCCSRLLHTVSGIWFMASTAWPEVSLSPSETATK